MAISPVSVGIAGGATDPIAAARQALSEPHGRARGEDRLRHLHDRVAACNQGNMIREQT